MFDKMMLTKMVILFIFGLSCSVVIFHTREKLAEKPITIEDLGYIIAAVLFITPLIAIVTLM